MTEVSEIPIYYFDDDEQERDYWRELINWVDRQPQDTWALIQKSVAWHDQADTLFESMIEDEDCDLAIAARIFWNIDIAYYVGAGSLHDIPWRIVDNFNAGYYQTSELALNRFEILFGVHAYSKAVRERGNCPFEIPRALFGPFRGREPNISVANEATRRHLEKIMGEHGLYKFCLTNQEWKEAFEGEYSERHYFDLPLLPGSEVDLSALDESSFIEAVYGKAEDFWVARSLLADDMPYAGRAVPFTLEGEFRYQTRRKRGEKQFFEGI